MRLWRRFWVVARDWLVTDSLAGTGLATNMMGFLGGPCSLLLRAPWRRPNSLLLGQVLEMRRSFDRHELTIKVIIVIVTLISALSDRCKGFELVARQEPAKIVLRF